MITFKLCGTHIFLKIYHVHAQLKCPASLFIKIPIYGWCRPIISPSINRNKYYLGSVNFMFQSVTKRLPNTTLKTTVNSWSAYFTKSPMIAPICFYQYYFMQCGYKCGYNRFESNANPWVHFIIQIRVDRPLKCMDLKLLASQVLKLIIPNFSIVICKNKLVKAQGL